MQGVFSGESGTGYLLEFILKKNEVLSETVQHLSSIPDVYRKCSVLLNSVQEEIEQIIEEIRDHLKGQSSSCHSQISNTNDHDYVIQFYDGKVRQLEDTIDELTSQNERENRRSQEVLSQLSNVEVELKSLREALSMKESSLRRLQSAEVGQLSELRQSTSQLQIQLKEKEKQLYQATTKVNQLTEQKLQAERETRNERANYTMKVLEVNKCLDETKGEFLKLVRELELENESLKKEITRCEDRLIAKEQELQLASSNLQECQQAREKLIDQLQAGKLELSKLHRTLEKRLRQHNNLLEEKKDCDIQIERFEQRLQEMSEDIDRRVTNKSEQADLLEAENKQLTSLLDKLQQHCRDTERALSLAHLKLEDLEKEKRFLLDELDHKRNEVKIIDSKFAQSSAHLQTCEKELCSNKQRLLQAEEAQQALECQLKAQCKILEREQARFQQDKLNIRQHYQSSIAELVRISHELESDLQQTGRLLRNRQLELEELRDQLKNDSGQSSQLHLKLSNLRRELSEQESKHQTLKVEKCLLAEELEGLKRRNEALEKKLSTAESSSQELNQAREQLQKCSSRLENFERQVTQVEARCRRQQQLAKADSSHNQRNIQQKLAKVHEQLNLRNLEVAQLTARNRKFEEENNQLRRTTATERSRMEARLNELESILREKSEFQSRVQLLYS